MEWTKMTINHRGVQAPGYTDPVTGRFIFVKEMVPEIVVPNLEGFEVRLAVNVLRLSFCLNLPFNRYNKLKAYVPYNVSDVVNEVFTAKELYKKTLEKNVVLAYKRELEQKLKAK